MDGFRGLAILLVIGFHYFTVYARDPRHLVPYGDALAQVPIFSYGFFGVMLFFSVSGFVIAMTLESSSNLLEFAVRRFARLWPTMLLCSVITYCVLLFWPTLWHQRLIDFLPSLTFMDGHHVWGAISPALESHWIDDVYWSLFVEVRFYFLAGVVYFFSKRRFASNMLLLMLVVSAAYIFGHQAGIDYVNKSVTFLFIEPYLPWFVLGLAAYRAWYGFPRAGLTLGAASVIVLGCLALVEAPQANLWAALIVASMFALCLYSPLARLAFSMRWLSTVGVSSYSLYLLHDRIGVTLIHGISEALGVGVLGGIGIAVAVALVMVGLAYAIYMLWEHPVNRWLVRRYAQWAPTVGLMPSDRHQHVRSVVSQ